MRFYPCFRIKKIKREESERLGDVLQGHIDSMWPSLAPHASLLTQGQHSNHYPLRVP